MEAEFKNHINKILLVLSSRVNDFYLAGGTALSFFYFNHRDSLDLDFFTKTINKPVIEAIMNGLAKDMHCSTELMKESFVKDKASYMMFKLNCKGISIKVDFIQDYFKTLKPFKVVNGINILSIEDIYLRKISAITGGTIKINDVGRTVSIGGRQEAKDYYDLFCLSKIFMRLSEFSFKYCNSSIRELLINWYRTYDRMAIKEGLMKIITSNDIEFNELEKYFKKETDLILEKEIDVL
ncbi:MAG: nucleotidyl transferase AbiEii/AbiGii toxin family protein [Candidatus Gygaella obscura]|nr:nucleotidyl transferase AbiEii/AbiGii toxin family protein [Candidatus Gygaella obscura]